MAATKARALFLKGGKVTQNHPEDADEVQLGILDTIAAGALTLGGTNATSILAAKRLNADNALDVSSAVPLNIGNTSASRINLGAAGNPAKVWVYGDLDVAGVEAFHGTATFSADANFNGNVTFGDGSGTDTVSFNAATRVTSSIVFGKIGGSVRMLRIEDATVAAGDDLRILAGQGAAAGGAGGALDLRAGAGKVLGKGGDVRLLAGDCDLGSTGGAGNVVLSPGYLPAMAGSFYGRVQWGNDNDQGAMLVNQYYRLNGPEDVGFRVSGGVMQFRNSGGSWQAIGAGGGTAVGAGTIFNQILQWNTAGLGSWDPQLDLTLSSNGGGPRAMQVEAVPTGNGVGLQVLAGSTIDTGAVTGGTLELLGGSASLGNTGGDVLVAAGYGDLVGGSTHVHAGVNVAGGYNNINIGYTPSGGGALRATSVFMGFYTAAAVPQFNLNTSAGSERIAVCGGFSFGGDAACEVSFDATNARVVTDIRFSPATGTRQIKMMEGAGAGEALEIYGADGAAGGNVGGNVSIYAGNGTTGTTGGELWFKAGDGESNDGGRAALVAGDATGASAGDGGEVYLQAGSSRVSGAGGNVTLLAGAPTHLTGTPGHIHLNPGWRPANGSSLGGQVFWGSNQDDYPYLVTEKDGLAGASAGVGFRVADPSGNMQFRNRGGSWQDIGAASSGGVQTFDSPVTSGNIAAGAPVGCANNAGTSTAYAGDANAGDNRKYAVGLATVAVTAGAPASTPVAFTGERTIADAIWDTKPVAADTGKPFFLSENVGKLTYTAPGTVGSTLQCLGIITYADASAGTTRVLITVGTPIDL